MNNMGKCSCAAPQNIMVQTYKRVWKICKVCGTAIPTQKNRYPFSFLPFDDLKKNVNTAEGMYDYFITDVHIDHAKIEASEFFDRYLKDKKIDFNGKSVLDVSGGNGFFINWFWEHLGARPSLTEYNKKTVEFAKHRHSFDCVVEYDMNADRLSEKVQKRFDIVVAKACLMFCDDVDNFVTQLKEVLNPGGILILAHSVEPTLGTLLRVQLDEFSYSALRQPSMVQSSFEAGGFELVSRVDETDPDLYVYDHDLLGHWMALHYFYEISGARKLRKNRVFNLPARDRRRSTFIFKA